MSYTTTKSGILKRMGVPSVYQDCTFDNFEGDPEKLSIRDSIRSIADVNGSVYLHGETTGAGKTHLAIAALARSWWNVAKSCIEVDATNDSITLSGYFSSPYLFRYYNVRRLGLELEMAGIELIAQIDNLFIDDDEMVMCLLLDELGREPNRCIERIECVLDEIYARQTQIIITSNLTMDGLESRYDAAIIRRLDQTGTFINVNWPAYDLGIKNGTA